MIPTTIMIGGWESLCQLDFRLDLPVGNSVFINDVNTAPRGWAERSFSSIDYWNEVSPGGHLAAFEQHAQFVHEARKCFRNFR